MNSESKSLLTQSVLCALTQKSAGAGCARRSAGLILLSTHFFAIDSLISFRELYMTFATTRLPDIIAMTFPPLTESSLGATDKPRASLAIGYGIFYDHCY